MEATGGKDHVDVGIVFDVFAEGVKAGAESWDKVTLFEPGEDSIRGGLKEKVQEMGMLFEEVPEVVGDSEGDVVIMDVGQKAEGFVNPFIILEDAAGGTEAGFAGKRDDDKLVGVMGAGVFGITEFIRVTAGEHFVDGVKGVVRDFVEMLGVNGIPVVFKDLADGDFAG